jgi:hypothetical protein
MSRKLTFGMSVIMILGLLVSACGAQVDVTGQINQDTGTGSLDINIGGGNDGGNSGTASPTTEGDNSQLANQTPVLSTQGLLILVGLGLLVVIGLLLGLLRSRSQE